jgi:hypothetical protein
VKLLDFIFGEWREITRRKEEKVKIVTEYLDELTGLVELFNFFARAETHLEVDEKGTPRTDEHGKLVYKKTVMEPEERDRAAFTLMTGVDFQDAIDQKRVSITLKAEKALDLIPEIDPSGTLGKKFNRLHWLTTDILESKIRDKDLRRFVSVRQEITEIRREIRITLQAYLSILPKPRIRVPSLKFSRPSHISKSS